LPFSDFDLAAMKEQVYRLNPNIAIFEVSAKTGEGIVSWLHWLQAEINRIKD